MGQKLGLKPSWLQKTVQQKADPVGESDYWEGSAFKAGELDSGSFSLVFLIFPLYYFLTFTAFVHAGPMSLSLVILNDQKFSLSPVSPVEKTG